MGANDVFEQGLGIESHKEIDNSGQKFSFKQGANATIAIKTGNKANSIMTTDTLLHSN